MLATTTQMLVQGALQHHLGHLIVVEAVEVINEESTLRVEVKYTVTRSRASQTVSFLHPGGRG